MKHLTPIIKQLCLSLILYTAVFTANAQTCSVGITKKFHTGKENKRSGTVIENDGRGNYTYVSVAGNALPSANSLPFISNEGCSGFTASITGQQNLHNPQYCLYSITNTRISCNNNGVFNAIPYGTYYIAIKDDAYDTILHRAFTVTQTLPSAGNTVTISNRTRSGFTAMAPSWSNMSNPQFCIKDSDNVVVSCNTTGVFNNLPYGQYCLTITDPCTGGIISRCFTESDTVPAISSTVVAASKASATSHSAIGTKTHLTQPGFCIYDNTNTHIRCYTDDMLISAN